MALGTRALPLLLGLFVVGCGARHKVLQTPAGASTSAARSAPSADDGPDETKTITVDYAFDRDAVGKDFDRTFSDALDKKGVKIDETLTAHAHFDVKDAKIAGTVTYTKKGGHYAIVEADLVTTGRYDATMQVELDVQVKGDPRNAKVSDWDKMLLSGKPVPLIKNALPANVPVAGPLVIHAHFDVTATCDMDLDGSLRATTGVGVGGDVRLGARYKESGFDAAADGKRPKVQLEAKAPAFELSPKPYLEVKTGKQRVKGRCSLQPTAVLLFDQAAGARLAVEPFVALDGKRGSAREKWSLDAQAGVTIYGSTDLDTIGRPARKPKELPLVDLALTKPGDEMGTAPHGVIAAAVVPAKASRVEVASVFGDALSSAAPSPVATKSSTPRAMRGLSKKKKL